MYPKQCGMLIVNNAMWCRLYKKKWCRCYTKQSGVDSMHNNLVSKKDCDRLKFETLYLKPRNKHI